MKKQKLKPTNTHKECFFVIPDMTNLSCNTGEPILGRCKYSEHLVLLSDTTFCKHFKKNTNGREDY